MFDLSWRRHISLNPPVVIPPLSSLSIYLLQARSPPTKTVPFANTFCLLLPLRDAPKKKKKQSRDRHSKTLEWPPASDPNPTTTSPSTSATIGGGATASLPPSSALPSAPTTTATEPFLQLPTLPPSLLPTFVRPLPYSILETLQECFSGTSDQATTTADPGGPSIAPSASATSTSTQPLLPITEDFLFQVIQSIFLFFPIIMTSLEVKKWDPEKLKQLGPMESVLETLWELAEKKEGTEKELKEGSDALANMEGLKEGVEEVAKLLAQKRKGAESSDSCRGSKREGGDPEFVPWFQARGWRPRQR